MAKQRDSKFLMSWETTEEGNAIANLKSRDDDGDYKVLDSRVFELNALPDHNQKRVAAYGLASILQDRTSQVDSGPDKLIAMDEYFAILADGGWEKERTRGAIVVSVFVEALADLYKCSVSDIQKKLKDYTEEQKNAIRLNAKVVAAMAAVEAKRASGTTVDLDNLLS